MSRSWWGVVCAVVFVGGGVGGVVGEGCEWGAKMAVPQGGVDPSGGPCPTIGVGPDACPVVPSYADMGDNLWPCPTPDPDSDETCASQNCTTGSGTNPLCTSFDPVQGLGCCCAMKGCAVQPRFNWILSTCQGSGCGAYDSAPSVKTYKDAGSSLVLNYVAAYQYSTTDKLWHLVEDSSFNTNGSFPAYDTLKPLGGLDSASAWLSPQPGGAAAWTWGYYPAGVPGLEPPGMLFVISTETCYNMAWYMLNQVTLDRGPAIAYPASGCAVTNDNCWSSGNAGEIDFLESPWTVNSGATDDYKRLYATQWNQIGRCFTGQMGSTCNADGGWFSDTETSNNYFIGSDSPMVWAAVVDKIGTFIYRIPADSADSIWPGLSRKTADCTLPNRPTEMPTNSGPPCSSETSYCALFLPNCQATTYGAAKSGVQGGANEGCKVNGQQGWCTNWWAAFFGDTGQWLWPSGGKYSVTQFQPPAAAVKQPWYSEMEAYKVDWSGNPQYNAGCCVEGQGNCPQ
ncbi:hypothetical protein Pelo_2554 [Pelomyxa schiedti]|nr:hypothetical protein Pelo_2554 [Pelomyxa schiedti]